MSAQLSDADQRSDAPADQTPVRADAYSGIGPQQGMTGQHHVPPDSRRQSYNNFNASAHQGGIYQNVALGHAPQGTGVHTFQMGDVWRALPTQYSQGSPHIYSLAPQPYGQAIAANQYPYPPQQQQYGQSFPEQSILHPSHNLHQTGRYQQHSVRGYGNRSGFQGGSGHGGIPHLVWSERMMWC